MAGSCGLLLYLLGFHVLTNSFSGEAMSSITAAVAKHNLIACTTCIPASPPPPLPSPRPPVPAPPTSAVPALPNTPPLPVNPSWSAPPGGIYPIIKPPYDYYIPPSKSVMLTANNHLQFLSSSVMLALSFLLFP